MPFRPSSAIFSLYAALSRRFSTTPKRRRLRSLSNIPSKHKQHALKLAQMALTDYLHSTRSLPFTFAEHISLNATLSLLDAVSRINFSTPAAFPKLFQKFLRYHPISEFEFFYESIGIDHREINCFLPSNKFFLSEDLLVFDAACAFASFGFPWNKLGVLYKENPSIFCLKSCELNQILYSLKDYGFSSLMIISICLNFPRVLSGDSQPLLDDLRKILLDSGLINQLEDNVDVWCGICRKIRLFFDLGCELRIVGELMVRSNVFVDQTEENLIQKIEFFSKLGVEKNDVGLLLLSKPEIFSLDLDSSVISVLGFLKHFGLEEEESKSIAQNYPYVLGRNKINNLPHVIRSLDLSEWFFDKLKNGDHLLLISYSISDPNEDMNEEFSEKIEKMMQYSRTKFHYINKINFLHSVGYGENRSTLEIFSRVGGTSSELHDRFDCLLRIGIKFSKICKMVSICPKILNQDPKNIEEKVKFLCGEAGSSLQYLDVFPAYLLFDLDKRIKPRYRFHVWLMENGLCTKVYSIASIIATSEKSFVARVSGFHRAAPKKWFECFLNRTDDFTRKFIKGL